MRAISIGVGFVFLGLAHATANFKVSPVTTHTGMCEPSGAVAFPEGSFGQMFVVANDEDNIVRVYAADHPGGPLNLPTGDLNKHLGLDPNDENDKVDVEGATWLNGKIYWIGSHSRSGSKGKLREARSQFFSTTLKGAGTAIELKPSSSSHKLLAAFAALNPVLASAIQLGVPEKKSLSPREKGFNIEGLTADADGKSMLLGLRNPLSAKNEALLALLANPEAVADKGEEPILSELIPLDLGGRGVRSIEYSVGAKAYFIAAGPAADDPPAGVGKFALYRWSGDRQERPQLLAELATAFANLKGLDDFHAEAMFIDATGRKLHLFSDDGDRPMPDGGICQDLGDKAKQSFRSVVITLE